MAAGHDACVAADLAELPAQPRRAEIYSDLRQVGSRPVGLKIGNLVFQHFNFVTTAISVVARALRVDFQSPQELPEPDEIGICRSFDHAQSYLVPYDRKGVIHLEIK